MDYLLFVQFIASFITAVIAVEYLSDYLRS